VTTRAALSRTHHWHAGPSWLVPRAAYVHVPFCAHKCGYCDFASIAGADALADRYLIALEREIATRVHEPQEMQTIFIGGGTPTRLDLGQLERLLGMVSQWFPPAVGGEWTVEANPGTLDLEKVALLAERGVNRISLGAQSFRPQSLRVLERNHEPEEVFRAVDLVRPLFASWSLDLIFGVPGSSVHDWRHDVETALALDPPHLSCYGLVFEKGTALWKQREAGLVAAIDEEIERAMYEETLVRLEAAGLAPYEISHFARPGHECRHNLVYWANDAYHGVGQGAARYLDGVRATNTRDLLAYLKRVETGDDPTGPSERLSDEEHARETAVLMLRRLQAGLERSDFLARTGFSIDELAGDDVRRAVRLGLLADDGQRIRLTREGVFLADSVLCRFLG
jgi:oxygen-independent coproporphyrinogen-3 oxidase